MSEYNEWQKKFYETPDDEFDQQLFDALFKRGANLDMGRCKVIEKGWIGVDLDGTLAEYDGWQGPEHIGKPIWPMVERIMNWIAEGKKVKIFTARATDQKNIPYILAWLKTNGLPYMEVTNVKDFYMDELWDDRCVQVVRNKGLSVVDQMREDALWGRTVVCRPPDYSSERNP